MESSQTLHDFVLNLLSDPQARTAFEVDPEGALHDAGLSDITATDVQDVVPLVIDYAPVQGLPELDTDQLGLGALEAGPAGAIQQLQLVTQQLPSLGAPSSAEVNAAAAGTLTAGTVGLTSWAGASVSGGEVTVGAGGELSDGDAFAAEHDVTVTLDAPALDGGVADLGDVTGDVHGLTHGLTGEVDALTGDLDLDDVTGEVHGLTHGLTGEVNTLTGGLTEGVVDLDEPAGSLPVDVPALDPVEETVSGTVGKVTGDVSQATGGELPGGDIIDDTTDLLF